MTTGPSDSSRQPDADALGPLPYPEARPPHLPDRLTAISPWVIPFVLLAVLQVWLIAQEWPPFGQELSPEQLLSSVSGRLASVASSLFGAALFLRHRDAIRTIPLLVFGTFLFAGQEVLLLLHSLVQGMLFDSAPFEERAQPLVLVDTAYQVFSSLVSVFAVLYTVRGLSAARRYQDVIPVRPIALGLVGLCTVSIGAAAVSYLPNLTDATSFIQAQFGLGLVITLLADFAWVYLFVTGAGALAAGERPRVGWLLASIAAFLFLLIRVGLSIVGTVFFPLDPVWLQVIVQGINVAWILLLLAFVVGLPSTAEPEVTVTATEPPEDNPSATPDRPGAMPPDSVAG